MIWPAHTQCFKTKTFKLQFKANWPYIGEMFARLNNNLNLVGNLKLLISQKLKNLC